MPTVNEFIESARSYTGVRWRHQGRNRAGVDCVGLIVAGLADIGIEIEDATGYRRSPEPERFVEHIRNVTDPVEAFGALPVPGDVAVFREKQQPCHVGIFTEKNGIIHILHSYAPIGKVMEEPFIHHWPRFLLMTRRLKGLDQ